MGKSRESYTKKMSHLKNAHIFLSLAHKQIFRSFREYREMERGGGVRKT